MESKQVNIDVNLVAHSLAGKVGLQELEIAKLMIYANQLEQKVKYLEDKVKELEKDGSK